MHTTKGTRLRLAALIAAAILLLSGWWLRRDRGRDGGLLPVAADIAALPATVAGSRDEAPGVVRESDRPGGCEHEAMLFLQFRFAGDEISLERTRRVAGKVKRQRSLAGKTGIYYRSLSVDGGVLADGVIHDPLALHYSLPAGGVARGDAAGTGARLAGGTIALESTEFVVRLPALEGSAAVELFSVDGDDASRSRFASPRNLLGHFTLAAADVR